MPFKAARAAKNSALAHRKKHVQIPSGIKKVVEQTKIRNRALAYETVPKKQNFFKTLIFGKKAENLSKEQIKKDRERLKGPIRMMEVQSGVLDCETLMIDKFTELEGRATQPVPMRVTIAIQMVGDYRQVVDHAKTALNTESNANINKAKTEISDFITTYEHV